MQYLLTEIVLTELHLNQAVYPSLKLLRSLYFSGILFLLQRGFWSVGMAVNDKMLNPAGQQKMH